MGRAIPSLLRFPSSFFPIALGLTVLVSELAFATRTMREGR
jgi:hypothetical protein